VEGVTPRTGEQRKAHVLAMLSACNSDVWVASSSTTGPAHLVPLSLAWDGDRILVALEPSSVTARNIVSSGHARCALGNTRDVVMIDATLDHTVDVGHAPTGLADAYASQADWDPRSSGGEYCYLVLRPRRIQVWREVDEIADRTVMRDGAWLV
jgi:hypothetical protein